MGQSRGVPERDHLCSSRGTCVRTLASFGLGALLCLATSCIRVGFYHVASDDGPTSNPDVALATGDVLPSDTSVDLSPVDQLVSDYLHGWMLASPSR